MAARYIRHMAGVRVLQVVSFGLLISVGIWLIEPARAGWTDAQLRSVRRLVAPQWKSAQPD